MNHLTLVENMVTSKSNRYPESIFWRNPSKKGSEIEFWNSRAWEGNRVTSHLQFEPEIVLKMISYCNH